VKEAQGAIGILTSQKGRLEGNKQELEACVNALKEDIADNKGEIKGLKGKIQANEKKHCELEEEIQAEVCQCTAVKKLNKRYEVELAEAKKAQ
jgi:chromosome segregation ATPase